MAHLKLLRVGDFRNIASAELHPASGVNVLFGRNAQGKTSVLEAVAFLSRGRSFRSDDMESVVRRGAAGLFAESHTQSRSGTHEMRALFGPHGRDLELDGARVTPARYYGRLQVVLYSTERLQVVRGGARERRAFIDRGAAALLPAYRGAVRTYERCLRQRNAALERGSRDLGAWTDALITAGAALRARRYAYVERLRTALRARRGTTPEPYDLTLPPAYMSDDEAAHRAMLADEIAHSAVKEQRLQRSVVGPHRDVILFTIDGEDSETTASSGQQRSLLLALSLATADVYTEETGEPPIALLDDLDSELDDERALDLCDVLGRTAQTFVTTAHPAWAGRLRGAERFFEVRDGAIQETRKPSHA